MNEIYKKLLSNKRLNKEGDVAYEQNFRENGFNISKDCFEEGYNKIINSYPFRRLQDKTQVFPLEQNDFIRTRLTHSIEVSAIAKELCKLSLNLYNSKKNDKIEQEYISKATDILMCAGLVHDFGNPPFGHYGEETIKNWFKNWFEKQEEISEKNKEENKGDKSEQKNENDKKESNQENKIKKQKYLTNTISKFSTQMKEDLKNFDGNVQNIRILTKLNYSYKYEYLELMGLNLTVSLLDTIIKYPKPSYDYENEKINKKFGYNLAEQFIYESIIKETRQENSKYSKHPLTFILEAADDIAYLTADFEDAIKKKILTVDEFIKFFKNKTNEFKNSKKSPELIQELEEYKKYEQLSDEEIFHKWSRFVKEWFMYCCSFVFNKHNQEILEGKFEKTLFDAENFHKCSYEIFRKAQEEFIFNEK